MGVVTENFDIESLQKTWMAFDRVAHLRPIRSDEEYDRTVALMNNLLDIVGDDERCKLCRHANATRTLICEGHLPLSNVPPTMQCCNRPKIGVRT